MKTIILGILTLSSVAAFSADNANPPIIKGHESFQNLRKAFQKASTDFSKVETINTSTCTGVIHQARLFPVAESGCGPMFLNKETETSFSRGCSYGGAGRDNYEVTSDGLQRKTQYITRESSVYYSWIFETIRILPSGDFIIEKSETSPSKAPTGGYDLVDFGLRSPVADVSNWRARVKVYYVCPNLSI